MGVVTVLASLAAAALAGLFLALAAVAWVANDPNAALTNLGVTGAVLYAYAVHLTAFRGVHRG